MTAPAGAPVAAGEVLWEGAVPRLGLACVVPAHAELEPDPE